MKYGWMYNEEHGCPEECCPPDVEPQTRPVVPYVYPTLEEWREVREGVDCPTCHGVKSIPVEDFLVPCPRCS